MKTIRTKLSVIFIVGMSFLMLSGIILNSLFLERYYIYKSKGSFIDINNKINNEYPHNRKNFFNFINQIDRIDGISTIIIDENYNVKYSSLQQKSEKGEEKLPREIEDIIVQNKSKLSKVYVYVVIEKPNDQAPKLAFVSKMKSGEIIILRKSMKGINESVAIANEFYIWAGIVIMTFGGVVVLVFANRITKPIVEMSNVAEEISNLDFSKRVILDSEDEIGNLGRSINKISEKLSASMNELRQDVERRKQLVRNISHELKTPIGVIKGYSEGLKYGVVEDKEKIKKYCNVISEECDLMDMMVKELLNLSMLESGMFHLTISQVDIGVLINNIADRFQPVFIEKEITLELNLKENLIISADYELIQRVVKNYIINAINHAEGIKKVKVTSEKKDEKIMISVYNTGKHIPSNELGNIWDVFYKVDKARSRQYGGHGLGLSIVKSIVELHGGVIGVENVDDGVRFYAEIP